MQVIFNTGTNYQQTRQAVGAAMLIVYLAHFVIVLLGHFQQEQNRFFDKRQIEVLQKKIILFGVAGLLSYGFL